MTLSFLNVRSKGKEIERLRSLLFYGSSFFTVIGKDEKKRPLMARETPSMTESIAKS